MGLRRVNVSGFSGNAGLQWDYVGFYHGNAGLHCGNVN
jgi:hypothetical protein